jgi:co-chaperonin GroES (HSP10)
MSKIDPGFTPRGPLLMFERSGENVKGDHKTEGGILIPEAHRSSAKKETEEVIVVAIGPEVTQFKVGDRILVHHLVGNEVTVRGRNFYTARPEDVLGKFEDSRA